MAYGNEIDGDNDCVSGQRRRKSSTDTSPDAIRRATIGRLVAILVFSFVPFMFVFICRLCVIFRGPPLVAFNFIFLHLPHFFIYLPWQTCKHIQSETLTLYQLNKKRTLPTRTHLKQYQYFTPRIIFELIIIKMIFVLFHPEVSLHIRIHAAASCCHFSGCSGEGGVYLDVRSRL